MGERLAEACLLRVLDIVMDGMIVAREPREEQEVSVRQRPRRAGEAVAFLELVDEHRASRHRTGLYLIASGFTGEPTAPVMGSGGATNRNS